jgi:hypothetical protein
MALARRDDWLQNAQGQALSGGLVYYCLQPANTGTIPPSPLANVYADSSGTPAANPQTTDGFGHAIAYLDNSQLYTIVYVHPQMGEIILHDQWVGTGSSNPTAAYFSGLLSGTVDGNNKIFLMTNNGVPLTVLPIWCIVWDNFPLVNGVGYSLALVNGQVQVTFAVAPQPGDTLFAQGAHL